MGLEIPTAKTPGEVLRHTDAPRPAIVGLMILGLTGLIFLFGMLVLDAMYVDPSDSDAYYAQHGDCKGMALCMADLSALDHDPAIPEFTFSLFGFKEVSFFSSEQVIVSFWLACIFFCLFFMTLLYQRFYADHVTIAKKRFRKWEDEGVQL